MVFLGTLRKGAKSLIFISEGVRGLGADATTVMADVVRAANESNTAIYTVDPRGLTARGASDSLYLLADNTGGRTIVNTNGLDVAMQAGRARGERVLSARLLVDPEPGGWPVPSDQGAGRSARAWTCARDAATGRRACKAMEEARAAAVAATPPTRRGAGPVGARRRRPPGTCSTSGPASSRGADGRPALTVAWARHRRGDGVENPARVEVSATNDGEAFEFEGAVDGPRPDVSGAGRGRRRWCVTVRDAENRVIDTETRTVDGSARAAARSAWASPVLLRARTPLELRTITADRNAAPFAGHDFTRTDRLIVRLALLTDAADATVTSRLVGRTGRELVSLPIAQVPGLPGSYQIDLPLTSVAPGDYVISVDASRGAEDAETFVAIRVGG